MQIHLPKYLPLVIILSSCVSASHQKSKTAVNRNSPGTNPAVTADIRGVDTSQIMKPDLPAGITPVSLMELERTEEGGFVLSPGLYEADYKTYCLQPGTPGPTTNDVYFQSSLEGSKKEIIQTILINSRKESHLDQKNVQLLLWSVVSHSDFHKLSPEVQYTATQLVSPKQLFELQGGVFGLVKTVARNLPSSGNQHDIRQLFDLSIRSYDAYERLAVVNRPSQVHRKDLTHDQWYKQHDGYYVRYLPSNYKQTRIQVFVPGNISDSSAHASGNYIVFDPASWVVVPANSNAQRLGIGGPVWDVFRSVVRKAGSSKGTPNPKQNAPVKTKDVQ